MKKLILFIAMASLIMIPGFSLAETYIDNSLTDQEYTQFGVPAHIKSVDDYQKAYTAFTDLKNKYDKCSLPRYDSHKSKGTFENLFNKNNLLSILDSCLTYEEKQRHLVRIIPILDSIENYYYYECHLSRYSNEYIRVQSLRLLALLLRYELFDRELKKNNLSIYDYMPEKKSFIFRAYIYDDYCGFLLVTHKFKDPKAKQYISEFSKSFEQRLSALTFQFPNMDFSKKQCLELSRKMRLASTNVKEK